MERIVALSSLDFEANAHAALKGLRILHVLDHSLPIHTGYTLRTAAILREQRALGWHTLHLTTPRAHRFDAPFEDFGSLRFHRTPSPKGVASRLPVVSLLAEMRATRVRLLELARAERPDVIHAHSPVLNALPALSVGRELGIPVVYEIRAFWEDASASHGTSREDGVRYRMSRALETHAARRAAAVTVICEGLRGELTLRGIPRSKITVIPNAVDVDQFKPIASRDDDLGSQLGLSPDSITLGFCGSFYSYEGLDLLLDAMPIIKRSIPRARLLLVGNGPEAAALRARVDALKLNDCVVFAGRVANSEIARYYSLIDILVYPRKRIRLTDLVTPLKPLEAMAQARLFVASDVGGHRELVEPGRTGVLFEPDNPDALARCVLSLVADRPLQATLVDNGRRYVESERTWTSSVSRYRDVYTRVLVGTRRARASG